MIAAQLHALIFATIIFHLTYCAKIPKAEPDIGLNTVQMIENHGYPHESHDITTEDGYILTFHRIPNGINNVTAPRPPVLLIHGLLSSSADFVNMGTNRSLGYILADLGYDVWIGNSRGNFWSRNHTTLDVVADAAEFFNFSWHEMGYYDLPAAVDYILEVNGDASLYYVGHSQGSADFLVLTSTRPEYNEKIKVATLMAPAVFLGNNNCVLTELAKYVYDLETVLKKYQIYELPKTELLRAFGLQLCSNPESYDLCLNVIGIFDGINPEQLEQEKLPVILSNAPSNTATKQFLHFLQSIKNGGFSQYDYGLEQNLQIYNSETPPPYNLSKVTVPVAVYYGRNDRLVNYLGVENLAQSLPNLVNSYEVPSQLFTHIDLLFAKDIVDLVYAKLIEVMQQF